MKSLNRAGIYIHIPFCVKKCNYCDFLSFSNLNTKDYFKAIFKEIEFLSAICRDKVFDTIFIGGGTPSFVEAEIIRGLLERIRYSFNIDTNPEITIETNPESLNYQKLSVYKKSGMNRISMGVQSFNDNILKILGRAHNSENAKEKIMLIKDMFENFNIDMMMALPTQDMDDLKKDIEILLSFYPPHVSYYSLILEEETVLYDNFLKTPEIFPNDNLDREMYHYVIKTLSDNSLMQYEISNFAKAGLRSRHNLKYWNLEEYIGLGLGASSYFKGMRWKNTSDYNKYLRGGDIREDIEIQSEKMEMENFCIFSLRKNEGIDKKEFKERFNRDFNETYKSARISLIARGLAVEDDDFFRESDLGRDLSNQVEMEFLL